MTAAPEIAPAIVPLLDPGTAPLRGVFGSRPEDFEVEERLAYQPAGEGTHLFLWIEKRGIPTLEAVRRLARFLDRPARAFGLAGMKDAQALSRQWISIEHVEPERLRGWTVNGVRVLRAERHGSKLRVGHGSGNRFGVLLRGAGADDARHARAALDRLLAAGLPNAYGPQRFGRGGASLRAGLALLRGDFASFAAHQGTDPRRVDRRLRALLISSVQSEVFDRVLARRMPALGSLRDGDAAWIHRNGACFLVEDARAEQPRADRFEVSPSGPLPGPRLLRPGGASLADEEAVMEEMGLALDDFASLPLGHEARGARRPLRVPVGDLACDLVDEGLRLRFSLPPGSYATECLRQIGVSVLHPTSAADR